eukprot:TRINITY_DN5764_c0_g1_i1.p1 TRINITY_DN5764_c0_g1~~TRINITY_DN5764_c0_g1_i1.p1  ORF type:complete len:107 (-),score=19.73 TRINITY_DN5764_c0_g1_i1:28-348(-)
MKDLLKCDGDMMHLDFILQKYALTNLKEHMDKSGLRLSCEGLQAKVGKIRLQDTRTDPYKETFGAVLTFDLTINAFDSSKVGSLQGRTAIFLNTKPPEKVHFNVPT